MDISVLLLLNLNLVPYKVQYFILFFLVPKYPGTTLVNLLRALNYPCLYFACVLSQPVAQYLSRPYNMHTYRYLVLKVIMMSRLFVRPAYGRTWYAYGSRNYKDLHVRIPYPGTYVL
eukprot:SAG11_NODE_3380_length_2488_cov_3.306823_1_plen_117_part_00